MRHFDDRKRVPLSLGKKELKPEDAQRTIILDTTREGMEGAIRESVIP